jgi:hypothetical protein
VTETEHVTTDRKCDVLTGIQTKIRILTPELLFSQFRQQSSDSFFQCFAGLEFHNRPGRDRHCNSRIVRIAADFRFGPTDLERSEISKNNNLVLRETSSDVLNEMLDDVKDLLLSQTRFFADPDD